MRTSQAIGILGATLLSVFPTRGGSSLKAQTTFVRGDVDVDGSLSVTDAVRILRHLFATRPVQLDCADAADVDDNGRLQVTDAIALLSFLFASGTELAAPFPTCGADLTLDDLGCEFAPPCGELSFAGLPLKGDGLFFVVDRSGSMQDEGELAIAKRELVRTLSHLPPDYEFSIVFFDQGLVQFPADGSPFSATPENIEAAVEWVASVPGSGGTCPQRGLLSALDTATRSTADQKEIVFVGDGGAVCGGDNEFLHLQETLSVVGEQNTEGVTIDSVGILDLGVTQREFLRKLAAQNGGEFVQFSL